MLLSQTLIDYKLATLHSEANRLILNEVIYVDGKLVTDTDYLLSEGRHRITIGSGREVGLMVVTTKNSESKE